MPVDIDVIGAQKVKSVSNGEVQQLNSLWQDQSVVIVFFRRWGCMLCRLWATELSEIAPVLRRHNVKLIGVGVEEMRSKEFVEKQFFDGGCAGLATMFPFVDVSYLRNKRGNIHRARCKKLPLALKYRTFHLSKRAKEIDLYYVEDTATYNTLGFKKFNVVSILASLFWKQSREALSKGQGMGLGGDLKGDWGQTGGAVLVEKGGKLLTHFAQTGPGDHLPNLDILKHFGLENEYLPDRMGNKSAVERGECLAASIEATS